jgi:hypothetical protein
MTPSGPPLLALAALLTSLHGGAPATHLDELLSLSELPLKNLLHVKRTFLDSPQVGKFLAVINYHSADYENFCLQG